jgi:hypothetical protein
MTQQFLAKLHETKANEPQKGGKNPAVAGKPFPPVKWKRS